MLHLVLGASGGIGHWVVEKLLERGRLVRIMVRNPMKVKHWSNNDRVEIVQGDSLVAEGVRKAASGAESIYDCVNAPYPAWKTKVIHMLSNTIAAAKADKAKIVFPGNVYVFGHARSEFVRENHPFAAHTKKGKIRIQMERMIDEAWKTDRIPYTIVRFPDFYGPYVMNEIYASMTWYGGLDVPIEFSFIEDAAEVLVTADIDPSTAGETYHVPASRATTPREWLQQIA